MKVLKNESIEALDRKLGNYFYNIVILESTDPEYIHFNATRNHTKGRKDLFPNTHFGDDTIWVTSIFWERKSFNGIIHRNHLFNLD